MVNSCGHLNYSVLIQVTDKRVGDRGFASHLEDHKLLYVSLEILLLTTFRRSRTPWVQWLQKGGQVRTALCEKKTKIKFSGHPTPQAEFSGSCIVNIQPLLSASSTVALHLRHQYVFFETPNRSMWCIDGVGVAQRILEGLNMN